MVEKHLKVQREEISIEWMTLIRKGIDVYASRPENEIQRNIERNIECIIDSFRGELESTDRLIQEIATLRVGMGFIVTDVIKAVQTGRNVLWNRIKNLNTEIHSVSGMNELYEVLFKLDSWFFYTMITHVRKHLFLTEMNTKGDGWKLFISEKEYREYLGRIKEVIGLKV